MQRFSKTITTKGGHQVKIDAMQGPKGDLHMQIAGPRSRLMFQGSPEHAMALGRKLGMGGKSAGKPARKNDRDADDR